MTPVQILAATEGGGNPLVPALYDIVWSAVCLAIVFLVVWKYVLPAFNKTLDERAERIQGGIEKAEKVQAEADAALAEYQKQLADGRAEAARLRAEAQEEGAQIIADMKAQAHAEADRIIASAQSQIEAERQAAMVSLRSEVGTLATDLASRIVGESLSDDQRAANVVDRFISDLESQSTAAPVKGA
ncbi:ATP synthase F0 subcomplex B subunit [Brevibacterium sanguinis]|uniref:ATP synthase subunit b n=2 Tax=Brevibacterium TaxID=1696 RepID=A0A366INS5_9MICO|nr:MULTISPECIES: F0F1 ATP synthase subunit B [Brevibacterium]RBP66348.1 ATP synthase F0 subcomplex B subunit [Brevibacterium sanguinis]RBP72999.1 ATP synthase F0 subcomplex B subunit [Brevibacterium celere]